MCGGEGWRRERGRQTSLLEIVDRTTLINRTNKNTQTNKNSFHARHYKLVSSVPLGWPPFCCMVMYCLMSLEISCAWSV